MERHGNHQQYGGGGECDGARIAVGGLCRECQRCRWGRIPRVSAAQPVDATSVLIAYTRTGDANLDGSVNDDDVTIVGATMRRGCRMPHWALGDFDYNGFVDDDDVTLLGAFYEPTAADNVSGRGDSNTKYEL